MKTTQLRDCFFTGSEVKVVTPSCLVVETVHDELPTVMSKWASFVTSKSAVLVSEPHQ